MTNESTPRTHALIQEFKEQYQRASDNDEDMANWEGVLEHRAICFAECLERELSEVTGKLSLCALANQEYVRQRDDYKADYFRRHKDAGDEMEARVAAERELEEMRGKLKSARELVMNLTAASGGLYALEKDFPVMADEVRALGLRAEEFCLATPPEK